MCGKIETRFDVGDFVMYEGRRVEIVEITENDHPSLPYNVKWVDENGDSMTDWAYEDELSDSASKYSLGDRVILYYAGKPHEGRITKVDETDPDLTYQVSFLLPSGNMTSGWRNEKDLSSRLRFKVGDRVMLNDKHGSPLDRQGVETRITHVDGSDLPYRLEALSDGWAWWAEEDEIEPFVAKITTSNRFNVGDHVRLISPIAPKFYHNMELVIADNDGSIVPYKLNDLEGNFIWWAAENSVEAWTTPTPPSRTLRFKVGDRVNILENDQVAPIGLGMIIQAHIEPTRDDYDYDYDFMSDNRPGVTWGIADRFVEATEVQAIVPTEEKAEFVIQWKTPSDLTWDDLESHNSFEDAREELSEYLTFSDLGTRTYRIIERKSAITEIVLQEVALTFK